MIKTYCDVCEQESEDCMRTSLEVHPHFSFVYFSKQMCPKCLKAFREYIQNIPVPIAKENDEPTSKLADHILSLILLFIGVSAFTLAILIIYVVIQYL